MLKIITKREDNMRVIFFFFFTSICTANWAQSLEQKLSNFPISTQNWLEQSCPKYLGPSLWKNCMEREMQALSKGIPDVNTLSSEDKDWIEQSCPTYLGPSLYKNCMEREKNALKQGMPSLAGLSSSSKQWVLDSCPRYLGPSLYRSCLQREITSLK